MKTTAVESVCAVMPEIGDPLYVMRASLEGATEDGDEPLTRLLADAALISSLHAAEHNTYHLEPSADMPRHIVAVGPDPLPVKGRSIFGFAVRALNHYKRELAISELSLDPTAPLTEEQYRAVGHALFDGLVSDMLPDANDYRVALTVHKITPAGRRLLIGGRHFMRSEDRGAYATSVQFLRRGVAPRLIAGAESTESTKG